MSWLALRAFFSGVPRWAYIALACAALILGYGHLRYNAGQASTQAKFDAFRADLAQKTAKANADARATEASQRQALAAIAATYDKELQDALAKERAVTAAVRAGALRLRKQWTCPPARTGQAAADPGSADEAADLRAADSGRLVRVGADADAQVKALQAALEAERLK